MSACPIPEPDLWLRYRNHGDLFARDQLVAAHAQWARMLAISIQRRVPTYSVDGDDFIQNAQVGLLEAVSRFDPAKGVEFRAYAAARVRGAVFNGIRDIIGNRQPASVVDRLQARAGDFHAADDVDPMDFLLDSVGALATSYFLDDALAVSGFKRQNDVFAWVHEAQSRSRLAAAIAELPERTRRIIELHYFSGVQFTEIAANFGLTRGRVSQIHHDALRKLKECLRFL